MSFGLTVLGCALTLASSYCHQLNPIYHASHGIKCKINFPPDS